MCRKIDGDKIPGKSWGETSIPEKDGKLKNLLKRSSYLTRWVGVSDAATDADAHQHNEKPNRHRDFARYLAVVSYFVTHSLKQ